MTAYLLIPYVAGFILMRIFPEYYFGLYPYIILLFLTFGMLFYLFADRALNTGRRQLVASFLMASSLKFIVSAMLIVLYAWFERERAIPFTLVYFAFYIVLSIYEIRAFKRMSVKQSDVR